MISCSVVFKAPYWRSAVIQACIHLIFLFAAEDDQVITSIEDEKQLNRSCWPSGSFS